MTEIGLFIAIVVLSLMNVSMWRDQDRFNKLQVSINKDLHDFNGEVIKLVTKPKRKVKKHGKKENVRV